MKKKVLSLVLVLVLLMSSNAMLAYADSGESADGDSSVFSTLSVVIGTDRISNTKAAASVSVDFTGVPDDYTVTITLQKKSDGKWVLASDVAKNTIKYIGSNKTGILTYDEWTVKKGVIYRIKVVSVDKYDSGIKYTDTVYSDPF